MGCEWECRHCKIEMTSLANGITWCPNCGKVTSIFVAEMMPTMSQIIFDAKRSAGQEVPESRIKVTYGPPEGLYGEGPPKLKVIQ